MRKKICLILLLMLIIGTFIISYGCGGGSGDNITQTISTYTPSAENNTEIESGGFICIKIKWPQTVNGSCIFSSGDNIYACGIPYTTRVIKITVRSDPDNPDNYFEDIEEIFAIPNGTETTERKIGPIPITRVKIRVEAYDDLAALIQPTTIEPISTAEKDLQIQPGDNAFSLNLGDETLSLNSDPVILEDYSNPSIGLDKSETLITGQFKLVSPDLVSSSNSIISQEEIPIEDRDFTFSIVSGYGALSPDGTNYYKRGTSPVTVTTDENGECSVILRADTGLDIWLLVEYYFDPADPASKIEEYYFVEVLGSYNFLSPVGYPPQIYYDDPARNTALILEKLIVEYPETGEASKAVPDRKITFEITDPPEAASFLWPPPLYRYTDENGECNINFTIMENAEVWISCRFPIYPDDPYSPAYSWYMLWYPGGGSLKSSDAWIYKCEKAEWIEEGDEFNPTTLK